MQICIKNRHLVNSINLLYVLSLKGKQSRHRTKLVNLLNDRLKEVGKQEMDLLKEHCHLDDDGNPKKINDGKNWDVKDVDKFLEDREELLEEEYIIDGGNFHGMLKTVKEILSECDVEFSNHDAVTYDYLCEVFNID